MRTKDGVQKCRFGYPKPLQPETIISTDEENCEPILVTARNDGLINSYNPVQLSAWRGNVDMQYCVSKHRVIEYITKYATKCEPRSETMKDVYANIVRNLKDDSTALQVVQKLLINSVGERDFSAQETCHLLLQLPLVKSTRDYVILSLDGSRQVQEEQMEDSTTRATAPSILDHYIQQSLASMRYLIIDEISMVGRKLFGQIDRRLSQVFPQHACDALGGCSCLLFGDFAQLPPVMDLPLYTMSTSSYLLILAVTHISPLTVL